MTDKKQDIQDSAEEKHKLHSDSSSIVLPEVKDIPGQEHVRPIPLKGLSDVTASSDDEEGKGIVEMISRDEQDEPLIITGTDTDISKEEVAMLERMDGFEASENNLNLSRAALDNTDEEGEILNERDDLSGSDLDVAAAEQDDSMEEIGEEDEENNIYSSEDD